MHRLVLCRWWWSFHRHWWRCMVRVVNQVWQWRLSRVRVHCRLWWRRWSRGSGGHRRSCWSSSSRCRYWLWYNGLRLWLIFHDGLVHWWQLWHRRVGRGWWRGLLHCSYVGGRRARSDPHAHFTLEVGSNPRETNCIQLLHTLICKLGLESSQSQRVFTSLFHHPSTKGLVCRIILRNINVSIVCFGIFQQLSVSIVPSCDWRGDTPLKANRIELVNPIRCQARLRFGALWQLAGRLEIGFPLVFSLNLDPLSQRCTLRNIAVAMFFLPLLQFFVSLVPTSCILMQHSIPDEAKRIQNLS